MGWKRNTSFFITLSLKIQSLIVEKINWSEYHTMLFFINKKITVWFFGVFFRAYKWREPYDVWSCRTVSNEDNSFTIILGCNVIPSHEKFKAFRSIKLRSVHACSLLLDMHKNKVDTHCFSIFSKVYHRLFIFVLSIWKNMDWNLYEQF